MSEKKMPKDPALKDVEPGGDADETPMSRPKREHSGAEFAQEDGAAAMPEGRKPGPKDSPVQVRNAGEDSEAEAPRKWDEVDEAVDESFPASDPSAKY